MEDENEMSELRQKMNKRYCLTNKRVILGIQVRL